MLGPKTESMRSNPIQLRASALHRPVPVDSEGSFSESEIKCLQTYVRHIHNPLSLELDLLLVPGWEAWTDTADITQCLTWLSLGQRSPCIQSAMLAHATLHHFLSRTVAGPDSLQNRMLQYQIRSCSDLRLAISRNDYIEVFYSSLLLGNPNLQSFIKGPDTLINIDSLVHLSGMWAALKQLSLDHLVTTRQWISFETLLLSYLGMLRTWLVCTFEAPELPPQQIFEFKRIMGYVTTIFKDLLDWPVVLIPVGSSTYENIRYRRLQSAFLFNLLNYAPSISRSIVGYAGNIILPSFRGLTGIKLQCALGIEHIVEALNCVDITVIPPSASAYGDRTALLHLKRYLQYKILECCLVSENTICEWNEVKVASYQLLTILDTFGLTWNLGSELAILFFAGLFLSKSRHRMGNLQSCCNG